MIDKIPPVDNRFWSYMWCERDPKAPSRAFSESDAKIAGRGMRPRICGSVQVLLRFESVSSQDEDKTVGLCASCRNVQRVRSSKGSTFYLCRLSAVDSRYAKYPVLPVRTCPGYEPIGKGNDDDSRPGGGERSGSDR